MFKFARAFLLCGLLVSTLTAADQNALVDVRSEEEALQGAFIEENGAEIGQPLKRVKKVPTAKQVLIASDADLLKITHEIWAADINRFSDIDVVYNVKGPKFFTRVNEERFKNVETYAKMIALFKCYDLAGMNCRDKEKEFHKAILDTPPIKVAREWAEKRGDKYFRFNDALLQYWFTRTGKLNNISGFKHTFVGEIGKDDITGQVVVKGLHNWVRMFLEENEGRLVYKHLIRSCPSSIEAIAFGWKPIKEKKFYHKISSAFIRTSPEVEIALYTICVLTRKDEDCPIQLNGNPLKISVSAWTVDSRETIRSAFPIC